MFVSRWSSLISVVLSLSASLAAAQEEDEAARLHFEAGRSHYENGAYEAARQEFEAAHELSGRSQLLYNLYLTYERLADLDPAIDYLERYLTEGEPSPARRTRLERRLQNLRERRGQEAAGAVTREGDLLPAAVAFGVAGAGLVSFAVFGGLALAEDDALTAGCGADGTCTDAQVADLFAYNVAADVSWVTAAVAAAAGVVLLVTLGLPSEEEEAAAAFIPWAAPGAAGISSTMRF